MRVLIAGAGVAGAAAAIALRRTGADVEVYEAHPDPGGDVGSFVSLAANGLRGLDALGCLDAVRGAGVEVERLHAHFADGELLSDTPRGRREHDTLRSVTLLRGHLVEALRARAEREGVRIRTGDRVVGVRDLGDRVAAVLGGGDAPEGDLLVGADGIWSAVRGAQLPGAPPPRYAGLYTLSGTSDPDRAGIAADPRVLSVRPTRAGGVFFHVGAPDGRIWWSAQVPSAEEPERRLGPAGADRLAALAAAYRDDPLPAALVSATVRAHPFTVMHAMDPVPAWTGGRAVLIGDAAHPVGAGQGASMALEDALVLAGLAGGAEDVPGALAAYRSERAPRIDRVLGMAAANRAMKKAGAAPDAAAGLTSQEDMEAFADWLYGYDPCAPVR
ncbi:NAD(P)/FAD-dependent oxidoreductase [Nocardiopsis sp. RSe5-2]|uniref:NAD(P)/FAD-dependent oxidoreductase n=1 Tax=Nocardiopsis endophytica TaxID=3018445 RepID=A0ABT4U4I2_9ACTN|nr:NAD(P)/FAD-dependent oxidoreductase [Nocardiopsis endophytica]MDA2811611.1 NAD(P)/FAD-dependent oxidoreductase [Nocardiopsis endophytica]